MFSYSTLIYIISSAVTYALIYFHLSTANFQQITAVLLFAILILLGRIMMVRNDFVFGKLGYFIGLFLSSFFVQILILATGGIYSSFLILIHLFTLGSSFLVNISSSMVFLALTLSILVTSIYSNPQMLAIFKDDPGSAALYFISFIVILPMAQYIVYRYHLKDTIFKVIKEYAETGEQREASILNNIAELVVVTDKNLQILSINEALEQSLNIVQEDCIGRSILEIVPLKNEKNESVTMDELSISQVLADKATRIMDGFYYKELKSSKLRSIAIQIRPVLDSNGVVSQIVFLITNPRRNAELQRHADLQEAFTKQKLMFEDLKSTLIKAGLNNIISKVELFNKSETDLVLAYEIQDHSIKPVISPDDIALIGKQAVASKQALAQHLGVSIQFILPKEEIAEASRLSLIDTHVEAEALPLSSFTAPVDKAWFMVLLQKLLDISLLLASEKTNQQIDLLVRHSVSDENIIELVISTPYQSISDQEIDKLFIQYYPDFTTRSNLYLGSGLEGYIAKNIINHLNIPFVAQFNPAKSILTFTFTITKTLDLL
ncbi:MAG: PAS domain-containing protein [Candidatus Daviesbacteria bacterium]|nr:PAS domain-containing protein [Candidatus Daviesbacteria bacterium]